MITYVNNGEQNLYSIRESVFNVLIDINSKTFDLLDKIIIKG